MELLVFPGIFDEDAGNFLSLKKQIVRPFDLKGLIGI
jgi:hypothetical protein